MATSNSYDFTVTRDDIIKDALIHIGVIDKTETPTADEQEHAARTLNLLAKSWMADGLNLWRREEATLFLTAGKQVYQLGPTGDHATAEINAVKASTTGITAMRVAGIATDTTLEVDSTTGMTAADSIGVVMDDNTIHWTTIDTVTDSDTVTIVTQLPSASAVDKKVYHYTSKIQRPLRMVSVLRRNSSGSDVPLLSLSEDEYMTLSNKSTQGQVNQFYYDPKRDGVGELHLWVTANLVSDTIFLSYQRPFQDFDATADNPDFPVEWFRALKYALAYDLAPAYGIPPQERQLLKMDLMEAKSAALEFDVEDTSFYISPDRTQYGNWW